MFFSGQAWTLPAPLFPQTEAPHFSGRFRAFISYDDFWHLEPEIVKNLIRSEENGLPLAGFSLEWRLYSSLTLENWVKEELLVISGEAFFSLATKKPV